MKVTAKLKDASISAQKGRLIVDMVRRMEVAKAIECLKFTPKKGAEIVLKVLQSAIANAENNNGADIDTLVIDQIYVDEAASLKRISPRAKGRANHIIKRRSHITVIVAEKE